jgi:hypothetical protein
MGTDRLADPGVCGTLDSDITMIEMRKEAEDWIDQAVTYML